MKILWVTSEIFGYMQVPVSNLINRGFDVEYLNFDQMDDGFISNSNPLKHIILKLQGSSVRKQHRRQFIEAYTNHKEYDKIIVVHPHKLDKATHRLLKGLTKEYITYLFDANVKFKNQKICAGYFDQVYSFEPIDCKENGYNFLANFIPSNGYHSEDSNVDFFNISSWDSRSNRIQNFVNFCLKHKYSFDFYAFNSFKNTNNIKALRNKVPAIKVWQMMKPSKVLVDFKTKNQEGLSFRIFEALGNNKKIITDNSAINNYPFYHPNFVCIVDFENLENHQDSIQELLTTPFPFDKEQIQDYTVDSWLNTLLNLSL